MVLADVVVSGSLFQSVVVLGKKEISLMCQCKITLKMSPALYQEEEIEDVTNNKINKTKIIWHSKYFYLASVKTNIFHISIFLFLFDLIPCDNV
jgi:hypothetical protein